MTHIEMDMGTEGRPFVEQRMGQHRQGGDRCLWVSRTAARQQWLMDRSRDSDNALFTVLGSHLWVSKNGDQIPVEQLLKKG